MKKPEVTISVGKELNEAINKWLSSPSKKSKPTIVDDKHNNK